MTPAGGPRKAPGKTQGHRDRAMTIVEPGPPADFIVPRPPVTATGEPLLPAILLAWDAYWLSPLPQALDGIDGVDRRTIVDDWIRLENELVIIEQLVQGERTVDGSKQQQVAHPLMTERHALRERLKDLRMQLGVGPRNRAQLGIDVAGAQSALTRLNEQLNEAGGGVPLPTDPMALLTRDELRKEAKRRGVRHYWTMRKAELLEAVGAAS
jgi:hypothetical protein